MRDYVIALVTILVLAVAAQGEPIALSQDVQESATEVEVALPMSVPHVEQGLPEILAETLQEPVKVISQGFLEALVCEPDPDAEFQPQHDDLFIEGLTEIDPMPYQTFPDLDRLASR